MKRLFTVIWKDITRFLPLWGSYSLLLLLRASRGWSYYQFAFEWQYYMFRYIHILALPYALICGLLLFGDLYNRARCYGLHAMPVSRVGWFSVHALAGVLFFLVPTGLCFGVSGNLFTEAFLKLCLHFLQCYGVTLLAVMLAGNRIGAVVIGLCIHALPAAAQWLYGLFFQPFLPSVGIPRSDLPAVGKLFYITSHNLYMDATDLPQYLFLGCAGLVLAVLALGIYRFRKLERVGSFAAVKGVQYVFVAAFSLIVGELMFQLLEHKAEQYYFLFLYIPVFYLVAAMLAEKRFFVFSAGHMLTLGILAAVLFNSLWIIRYDALGILDYVPDSKSVRSVDVFVDENRVVGMEERYYDYAFFQEDSIRVIDPDDIKTITQIHKKLLKNAAFEGKHRMIYLTYTLKSGIKIRRYYSTYPGDYYEDIHALEAAISTRSALFGDLDWETYPEQVYYIGVSHAEVFQRLHFAAPEDLPNTDALDVVIHKEDMRQRLLDALVDACDRGYLNPVEPTEYIVTIKSRDRWGREKTVELSLPDGLDYIDYCWKLGSNCPDRTITDDTDLTDYR